MENNIKKITNVARYVFITIVFSMIIVGAIVDGYIAMSPLPDGSRISTYDQSYLDMLVKRASQPPQGVPPSDQPG